MHYYHYRWLYAFAIFFSLISMGILYDIYPNFTQLKLATKIENNLAKKIILIKESTSKNRPAISLFSSSEKDQVLKIHHLVMFAQKSGLRIKKVNVLYDENEYGGDKLNVQLIASGDFMQLAAFIFAIENRNLLVSMHDFSCKLIQNTMLLSMSIWVANYKSLSYAKNTNQNFLSKWNNPFCLPYQFRSNAESNTSSDLQRISIDQLKMIGYLHKNERTQALILLPNGIVKLIGYGSTIGKEHGKVVYIYHNKIIINLQNEKTNYVIKMFK